MNKIKQALARIQNPVDLHIPTSAIRIIGPWIPTRRQTSHPLHRSNPSLRAIIPKLCFTIPSILLPKNSHVPRHVSDDIHTGIPFTLVPEIPIRIERDQGIGDYLAGWSQGGARNFGDVYGGCPFGERGVISAPIRDTLPVALGCWFAAPKKSIAESLLPGP